MTKRSKYAHYTTRISDKVTIKRTISANSVTASGERVIATTFVRFDRIPSQREFVAVLVDDITPSERALAEEILRRMPAGGHAEFPVQWRRRRYRSGVIHFYQRQGRPIELDSALEELELSLLSDASFWHAVNDLVGAGEV